jgi:hypothetical protein
LRIARIAWLAELARRQFIATLSRFVTPVEPIVRQLADTARWAALVRIVEFGRRRTAMATTIVGMRGGDLRSLLH